MHYETPCRLAAIPSDPFCLSARGPGAEGPSRRCRSGSLPDGAPRRPVAPSQTPPSSGAHDALFTIDPPTGPGDVEGTHVYDNTADPATQIHMCFLFVNSEDESLDVGDADDELSQDVK